MLAFNELHNGTLEEKLRIEILHPLTSLAAAAQISWKLNLSPFIAKLRSTSFQLDISLASWVKLGRIVFLNRSICVGVDFFQHIAPFLMGNLSFWSNQCTSNKSLNGDCTRFHPPKCLNARQINSYQNHFAYLFFSQTVLVSEVVLLANFLEDANSVLYFSRFFFQIVLVFAWLLLSLVIVYL